MSRRRPRRPGLPAAMLFDVCSSEAAVRHDMETTTLQRFSRAEVSGLLATIDALRDTVRAACVLLAEGEEPPQDYDGIEKLDEERWTPRSLYIEGINRRGEVESAEEDPDFAECVDP